MWKVKESLKNRVKTYFEKQPSYDIAPGWQICIDPNSVTTEHIRLRGPYFDMPIDMYKVKILCHLMNNGETYFSHRCEYCNEMEYVDLVDLTNLMIHQVLKMLAKALCTQVIGCVDKQNGDLQLDAKIHELVAHVMRTKDANDPSFWSFANGFWSCIQDTPVDCGQSAPQGYAHFAQLLQQWEAPMVYVEKDVFAFFFPMSNPELGMVFKKRNKNWVRCAPDENEFKRYLLFRQMEMVFL